MSNTPPFKEAWAHDFAPPIHSLDRHGDFAPPLLALGLAAGFFGVGTEGNGLQYKLARQYGAFNIGDSLNIESTTGRITTDLPQGLGDNPNVVIKADVPNADSNGIILWAHDAVQGFDPAWQLLASGLIYYMDGQSDLGYTQGGNITRYSGGGTISFYTTDGAFNGAGDFNVYTTGSLDNVAGSITLDARAGNNQGQMLLGYGTDGTLTVKHNNATVLLFNATGGFDLNPEDDSTLNLDTGKTYTINDGSNSPLVTYTG